MSRAQNGGNVETLTSLITGPVALGPAILDVLTAADRRLKVDDLRKALAGSHNDLSTFDDDLAMLKLLKVVSGRKTLAATAVGIQVSARLAQPVVFGPPEDPRDAQARSSLQFVLDARYRPLGPAIVRALGPGPMTQSALATAVATAPDNFLFGKVLGLFSLEIQPAFSDPVLVLATDGSKEWSLGDLGKAVLAIMPKDA
jgi:hypothetical protein